MTEQTWQISDADGSNKRTVTLAQYRAELSERAAYARKVGNALRAGDLKACAEAQGAMRAKFGA